MVLLALDKRMRTYRRSGMHHRPQDNEAELPGKHGGKGCPAYRLFAGLLPLSEGLKGEKTGDRIFRKIADEIVTHLRDESMSPEDKLNKGENTI